MTYLHPLLACTTPPPRVALGDRVFPILLIEPATRTGEFSVIESCDVYLCAFRTLICYVRVTVCLVGELTIRFCCFNDCAVVIPGTLRRLAILCEGVGVAISETL